MKTILLTLLLSALAIPATAQSYIGAGIGVGRSTSDFDPTPVEFFGVAQKKAGPLHFRGLAGIRTQPQLPTLFQEGAAGFQQDGYELFARPEIDLNLFKLGGIRTFAGVGADFFYQVFPNEPGGKDSHYHAGLNPIISAGGRYGVFGGKNRTAVTRIFQELKAREFPYQTAYKPGAQLIDLQHRGLLNPAYIEGWRLSHEYARPIGSCLSFYFAGEGSYVTYKEFPIKTFADSYYERDAIVAFRFGLLYR